MPLDVTPVQRNLRTRVTFLGLEAEDLFAKLMGEVVEPRREFIQDNALNAELDV